jgi:hypothetical protein
MLASQAMVMESIEQLLKKNSCMSMMDLDTQ